MRLANKAIRIAGALLAVLAVMPADGVSAQEECAKPVYLTFDTGHMGVARLVGDVLKRQGVLATFFIANEPTRTGGTSLDDTWAPWWREMTERGHRFGSHTYDHVYFVKDGPAGEVFERPQFGPKAGITVLYNEAAMCREIRKVDDRFKELTGSPIQKIWRAPGGKTSPRLIKMGNACGFQHMGWHDAGFLGDELSSLIHPNHDLLQRASQNLQDGDIAMAHLGIWSRKDPWAPAVLEQLIIRLKNRGFCFGTLPKQGK
ncbi:MAG: polysaccharide deacetylase family protein [Burkholderiales bacterium]